MPENKNYDQLYESFLNAAEGMVRTRFPLISALLLSDRSDSAPTPVPPFIGLIALIASSASRPCCVVLPDHQNVSLAVSTLLAISKLQADVPEILRSHASTSFQKGDRVLVRPRDFVYEWNGYFSGDFFRLKVLERNESRSFPVEEVARLEKTTRKRPKGYLDSPLGTPSPSVLGTLVGIPGTVNRNFLKNYVLLLASKASFREQLSNWFVCATGDAFQATCLKDQVPFGEVLEDGALQFFDSYVSQGEPLIAIASRSEDLVAYSESIPRLSRSVIIEDAERAVRNLQSYDLLAEQQRVLVVASDSQYEHIRTLWDRGCEVWNFSPEELLFDADPRKDTGILSPLLRKAAIKRDFKVSVSACANEILDEAASDIMAAERAIPAENDNPDLRDLFFTLFGVLMACAEHLSSEAAGSRLPDGIKTRLKDAETLIRRAQVWLSPKTLDQIRLSVGKLWTATEALSTQVLSEKGRVLLEHLSKKSDERGIAVVVRSETPPEGLRRWLCDLGYGIPVYRIAEVPTDQQFEQLVLVAWPSARRFDRLVRFFIARELHILAYPFEQLWLQNYRQCYERSQLPELSSKRKKVLIGLSQTAEEENASVATAPPHALPTFDLPVERFLLRRKSTAASSSRDQGEQEEFVDASYVDFFGATFAYVTEGHGLPVINDYVNGTNVSGGPVPYRLIQELNPGDFVLFRESGDSDIIRFIVEDEIGEGTYKELRVMATRWRTSLKKLGTNVNTVWSKLRDLGFTKQQQTVRNWLTNEQMIGPKDTQDLLLIVQASKDNELKALLPKVESAIERIKGYHIRAGFHLTKLLLRELPKHLDRLGGTESQIDLGFGKIWIVRVEDIDRQPTQCRRSLVNRLLWDESNSSRSA